MEPSITYRRSTRQVLDLAENKLEDTEVLSILALVPELSVLDLKGNPMNR